MGRRRERRHATQRWAYSQVKTTSSDVNGMPSCMVIDAAETAWAKEELLGKPLSREQVMADPIKQEAFDFFDRIVQDDPRVREFVYGVPSGN